MLGNKHHAFEDLAAAARLLVARGFASRRTLGLYGYSGGGLLVGTTEVQHPERFGAVVEGAGPVDVLRGHTYGSESFWAAEVGSPQVSNRQFRWLYGYAPLVHIRKGVRYPPTLITTEADDQRVSPAHAYKFAATLQWAQAGAGPIVLYVAQGTGHIGGGTLVQQAAPLADAETFLFARLSGADAT
jgi:prolyl oligopeptidase